MVLLTCPYGVYINAPMAKYCSIDPYNICLTNDIQITYRYPLRLQNNYSNIMCKYSTDGNCEKKRIGRTCCLFK